MLKLLLLFAVVLMGIWLWRRDHRPAVSKPPQSKRKATPLTLPIVACSHCGTHTDAREMIKGELGVYCSHAHCQLSGDRAKP
jgi:uncharacterized protein